MAGVVPADAAIATGIIFATYLATALSEDELVNAHYTF
jgi:hypothetical protein